MAEIPFQTTQKMDAKSGKFMSNMVLTLWKHKNSNPKNSKPFSKTFKTFSKPQENICASSRSSYIGVCLTPLLWHLPHPMSLACFHTYNPLNSLGSQVSYTIFKTLSSFFFSKLEWNSSTFQGLEGPNLNSIWKIWTFSWFPNPVRTMEQAESHFF